SWIHQAVETSVGILHFDEEIILPLCFLKQVAPAIAAFRDAEIIERPYAWKSVSGKDQVMNQRGAIDGVLTIIPGIMMPSRDVKWTRIHKGEQAGVDILQLGRCRLVAGELRRH